VFACICRAVTSDRVSTAIDNGATGACTGCGTCRDRIEKLIGERVGACPLKALQTA
jgi:bacterioferritin-associated ferredoxin